MCLHRSTRWDGPRERGMLERDMWDLRSFRENGGYARGYRDGPRW